jgi:5,10-methylenetetrahydrofolate reductase
MISTLMSGHDMAGQRLDGTPNFFPGAVINPQTDIPELEIIKMEKKVAAGAQFFQTQAVYDVDAFASFMKQIEHLGTKVLAGIVLLKSYRMGRFMNEKIPGIRVPEALLQRLEKSSDPRAVSLAIARELIAGCQDLCHGVHLMTIGWYHEVEEMLQDLRL